jgi:very-short-patch-repair endonuclease
MDEHREGPLELMTPNSRRIDLPGVIVRRGSIDPADVVEVDGIRCTGIARTLCDLGDVETPAQLKLAFEWAWRSGHSLGWIEQTAERLAGLRTPGPKRVLALVDRARGTVPTESALEVKVEEVIGSLPGIVRQHEIRRRTGEFLARVDFAIPPLKIAIEAHSRERHFTSEAIDADGAREADMQAEGWIVRFVTDAHRRRPDRLRSSLLALIAARAA